MKLLRLLALAGILASLAAIPASAASDARIRVLHASPDAPAVDVYLDGSKVAPLTNVPFGTISDYLAIPAGTHKVAVYATGTTTSPVIDASLPFEAGKSYTVAATNALAKIEAHVLVDDPTPVAGKAQVRVVHFSADAPAVDVAPNGAPVSDALVKNLSYPRASAYATVPANTYNLQVRLAGTTTVALQLEPITLKAGTSYSVFAIGSAANPAVGGKALQVVAAVDATAAAPSPSPRPTPPATSTDPGVARDGGLPVLLLALLAGFAASFLLASLRLRSVSTRR